MADDTRAERRNLVGSIAARMRERVYGGEPEERLGSLRDLAGEFGVGIVTIQQAARILEHEGLLEVRRGPGGGYYGRRPDEAALERALAAYMRLHPRSLDEALDITSLLFIELCGAAARSTDAAARTQLARMQEALRRCRSPSDLEATEMELENLLFRMVNRPIFELLTRVTIRFASAGEPIREGWDEASIARWAAGRLRILAAIQAGDEPLARFEADRSNRQEVMGAVWRRTYP